MLNLEDSISKLNQLKLANRASQIKWLSSSSTHLASRGLDWGWRDKYVCVYKIDLLWSRNWINCWWGSSRVRPTICSLIAKIISLLRLSTCTHAENFKKVVIWSMGNNRCCRSVLNWIWGASQIKVLIRVTGSFSHPHPTYHPLNIPGDPTPGLSMMNQVQITEAKLMKDKQQFYGHKLIKEITG